MVEIFLQLRSSNYTSYIGVVTTDYKKQDQNQSREKSPISLVANHVGLPEFCYSLSMIKNIVAKI